MRYTRMHMVILKWATRENENDQRYGIVCTARYSASFIIALRKAVDRDLSSVTGVVGGNGGNLPWERLFLVSSKIFVLVIFVTGNRDDPRSRYENKNTAETVPRRDFDS